MSATQRDLVIQKLNLKSRNPRWQLIANQNLEPLGCKLAHWQVEIAS